MKGTRTVLLGERLTSLHSSTKSRIFLIHNNNGHIISITQTTAAMSVQAPQKFTHNQAPQQGRKNPTLWATPVCGNLKGVSEQRGYIDLIKRHSVLLIPNSLAAFINYDLSGYPIKSSLKIKENSQSYFFDINSPI